MTQTQAVIETIDKLGGIATLNQINQHIFEVKDCVWKTKTPFATYKRKISGIVKAEDTQRTLFMCSEEMEERLSFLEDE